MQAEPPNNALAADYGLIDTAELARRTGTSTSTWTCRRVSGDGPPFIKVGKCVRYQWRDVEAWLESQKRRSTSDTGEAAE